MGVGASVEDGFSVGSPRSPRQSSQNLSPRKENLYGSIGSKSPRSAGSNISKLLHGDPSVECKSDAKLVRIFTSSTFTDTKHERNALMEQVYPKLKSFCQELGYEFQVVDMRWGVREGAEDDHSSTELCLKELQACQKLSTGPNFVTFLSHKYGYRPFMRKIDAVEFEQITKGVSQEDQNLLDKWFKKDLNAVPAMYILQPISAVYPDFYCPYPAKQMEAKNSWWAAYEHLQRILVKGARQNLQDPKRVHQYLMSVTERELQQGILSAKQPEKHCLWFRRIISDIDTVEPSRELARYHECRGGSYEQKTKEAHGFMKELSEKKLPAILPEANRFQYSIEWQDTGVDPAIQQHKKYLADLCRDFEKSVKDMILQGVQERQRSEVSDSLYNEVVQHVKFCEAKCLNFNGRNDVIKELENYVRGPSSLPLVVHGESGCGKTSLMAVTAKQAWTWMARKGVVIYRFIGTTRDSSTLRPLLASIVSQVLRVYQGDDSALRTDLKYLVEDFRELMKLAKKSKPLVIILDSLDQLDNIDGGRHLHWLPRTLPPDVKIILSTLPQEKYGCFPRLKSLYPKSNSYLSVPTLDQGDIKHILTKWLHLASRKLTKQQVNNITKAFKSCRIPLFLKLSFDEAVRWHSYDLPEKTVLEETVTETITALFRRLEWAHGKVLVSHALGFLTASQSGVTEGELEDLLSMSDAVLNDVYQFWTPPVRRLPPLLWVRIKNDLEEYLVNRGVDGVQVIYWYHRQFIETARSRYLSSADEEFTFHLAFAEYFLGLWTDHPKPYVDKSGKRGDALRYVAQQPIKFEKGDYNLRKLMQLPFHLIGAKELKALKSEALCNYEFLLAKLKAAKYRAVIGDLKAACKAFPNDQDLHVVKETFQLSQDALQHPEELAGQLVGRIHGTGSSTMLKQAQALLNAGLLSEEGVTLLSLLETFEELYKQQNAAILELQESAHKPTIPALLPHRGYLTPPGGQLLQRIHGHIDTIADLDITQDGKIVATGSFDNTVKLWDVESGEMTQSVDFDENVGCVCFCHQDKWVAVSCEKKDMFIIDTEIGSIVQKMKAPSGRDHFMMCMPIAVCMDSDGVEKLVAMRNDSLDVWTMADGKRWKTTQNKLNDWSVANKGALINSRTLVSANQYAVYAGFRSNEYHVLDVDDMSINTVQLFSLYNFNPKSELKDFPASNHDHIGGLNISRDGSKVIVNNGANQNLYFYDVVTGKRLRGIAVHREGAMRGFYVSPDDESFFFCTTNMVGKWNIGNNLKQLMLQHPCLVKKVVCVDDKTVVTIAEDDILRIWDRSKKAAQLDMTAFTGQVTLGEGVDAGALQGAFGQMFSNVTGEDLHQIADIEQVLTTKETLNYWTSEEHHHLQEELTSVYKVVTKFHKFENTRYLGVSQTSQKKKFTYCFTVWDLNYMCCMRRMFFPRNSVVVCSVLMDSLLVYIENRRLKTLNLKTLVRQHVFPGIICDRWIPLVEFVKSRNELITETRGGRYLKLFNVTSGEMVGHLVPSSDPVETHVEKSDNWLQFTLLQVNKQGSIVVAMFGHMCCVWNLEDRTISHSFSLKSQFSFINLPLSYDLFLSPSGRHLVLTADTLQPVDNNCWLFSIDTGQFSKIDPEVTESSNPPEEHVVVLRQYKKKQLHSVAITKDHKGYIERASEAGLNARSFTVSHDGKYIITWCPEPKERTVRYWTTDEAHGGQFNLLGTFTQDEEVTDAALINVGQAVVVNSRTGLIKLQLCGQHIKPQNLSDQPNPFLFTSVELNAVFPEGDEDMDALDDPDDKDLDMDRPGLDSIVKH